MFHLVMFCLSLWYDDVRVLNPQPPTLKVIGCSPHIQQPEIPRLDYSTGGSCTTPDCYSLTSLPNKEILFQAMPWLT